MRKHESQFLNDAIKLLREASNEQYNSNLGARIKSILNKYENEETRTKEKRRNTR